MGLFQSFFNKKQTNVIDKKAEEVFKSELDHLKKMIYRDSVNFSNFDAPLDSASYTIESFENYNPGLYAPNDENNVFDRCTTIARCRDSYNNDPNAKGLVNRIVDNSVGINGLTLKPCPDAEILDLDKEQMKRLCKWLARAGS